MHRREFLLSGAAITGTTAIGAVAFTTASVEREVTIDVASDDQGIIGLAPGTTNAVELVDGVLTIDTTTDRSDGLNPDGLFVYGNEGNPASEYAFSVTNNDDDGREFTFGLESFSLPSAGELTLTLYDDSGTVLGDLTPDADQVTSVDPGEAVYVHIRIDTTGASGGDDLSGTLSIEAQ